jgi:hypothetical protein
MALDGVPESLSFGEHNFWESKFIHKRGVLSYYTAACCFMKAVATELIKGNTACEDNCVST